MQLLTSSYTTHPKKICWLDCFLLGFWGIDFNIWYVAPPKYSNLISFFSVMMNQQNRRSLRLPKCQQDALMIVLCQCHSFSRGHLTADIVISLFEPTGGETQSSLLTLLVWERAAEQGHTLVTETDPSFLLADGGQEVRTFLRQWQTGLCSPSKSC